MNLISEEVTTRLGLKRLRKSLNVSGVSVKKVPVHPGRYCYEKGHIASVFSTYGPSGCLIPRNIRKADSTF